MLLAWTALVLLTAMVEVHLVYGVDRWVTASLQAWHPHALIEGMRAVSWFGYSPQAFAWPVLTAMGFLLARRPWRVLAMGGVGVGAAILAAMKLLLRIPRPLGVHRFMAAAGYGYPSGHAYLVTVMVTYLLGLPWLRQRPWTAALGVGAIVLVDISRVLLGDHWTSQVLAGDALGAGVALTIRALLPSEAGDLPRSGPAVV